MRVRRSARRCWPAPSFALRQPLRRWLHSFLPMILIGPILWTATYYHPDLTGETTALGEIYDPAAYTVACHPSMLYEWLLITNVENGKSVLARCNDTGPFVWNEDEEDWDQIGDNYLDMSEAAFAAISPLSRGVIEVEVSRVCEDW